MKRATSSRVCRRCQDDIRIKRYCCDCIQDMIDGFDKIDKYWLGR